MKILSLLKNYLSALIVFYVMTIAVFNITNMELALNLLFVIETMSILLSFIVLRILIKKVNHLKKLIEISEKISDGNLDVDISYEYNKKDEFNQLAISLTLIRDSLSRTLTDIENLSILHERGYADERIDSSYYYGNYRSVIVSTNKMVESYSSIVNELVNSITNIADGNFDFKIKEFTGKKEKITKTILLLQSNLKGINNEIDNLSKRAIQGELSSRAKAENFSGDWQEILNGLNELLEVVVEPINESSYVLQEISSGNFGVKIKGNYQGDFLIIKDSMNNMIEDVSSYIHEISYILTKMSKGSLDISIENDYIGEYSNIKEALNLIADNLNLVIGGINETSNNVEIASNNIDSNTKNISDGARRQNDVVEKLVSSIEVVNNNADENVKNVSSAEKTSKNLSQSAKKGSEQMDNMMKSMDSINESSRDILKIIKVIEDIAFQTNLLSLNASVEAARAGIHGRGFAVVAEEVGVLAVKSQDAVKTTSELIMNSSKKVKEGTEIAVETEKALKEISEKVNEMLLYINQINTSSLEQKEIIAVINDLINDISMVVNANVSLSEHSEAQTENLLREAADLKEKVSKFKLR